MATSQINLVTPYNPNDVSKWSGTIYSIFRSLTENSGGANIQYTRGALALFDLGARLINKACKLFGLSLDCRFSTAYAMLTGTYLSIRCYSCEEILCLQLRDQITLLI
jgi:hypothetical protein